MKPVELERMVKKSGWFFDHQTGSHRIYKHISIKGIIVIPFHGSKDLPKGITHSILKKAGIK
ncbi:MAG: type II toxin-antitoxin system HicA family toxin [Saprospiraceae bacterium]|uniref:Type II toxin-antitoxin system HicA family toxin n=1 Tax=Candidatus Opimibacter skivensis TaxID=2982028 RepID=A0A9D7T0T3_9BACT|nr:type II toxin-antitoxin system HicA family toxin [Candidatus Opimibacter skivensis]